MINKKVHRGSLGCNRSTIEGLFIVSAIDDYNDERARVVLDANQLTRFVSDLIRLMPEEEKKKLNLAV